MQTKEITVSKAALLLFSCTVHVSEKYRENTFGIEFLPYQFCRMLCMQETEFRQKRKEKRSFSV